MTANPRGRPNRTLLAAVVQALIQMGNSARLYCCPRQVLMPRPATENSSWFTTMNGMNRTKKSTLRLLTGRIPSTGR